MEEFSWSDSEIIPKIGDFSFIINPFIQKYLTHDYAFFKSLKLFGYGILKDPKDFNSRSLKLFRLSCYPHHTDETYQHSLLVLEHIIIDGWTEFVINCLNCLI